jgi:hypothetical protein
MLASYENALILKAAQALYTALHSYHDYLTPSDVAVKMADEALALAEGR